MVPVIVVGLRLRKLRFAGDVNLTFGIGAKTTLSVDVVELPATSVARTLTGLVPGVSVTLQLKLLPVSDAGTPLHETEASPESESDAVPFKVICCTNDLVRLEGEVRLRLGGVRSSFTVTDVVATLPALSIAVPTM